MPDNEIGTSLLPVVTHRDAFIGRIEEMFAYPQKKEQSREAQADESIICPAVPASGRAITMADRTTTPVRSGEPPSGFSFRRPFRECAETRDRPPLPDPGRARPWSCIAADPRSVLRIRAGAVLRFPAVLAHPVA